MFVVEVVGFDYEHLSFVVCDPLLVAVIEVAEVLDADALFIVASTLLDLRYEGRDGGLQVDESTLPVIDNEKHRAVKGYIWAVRDAVCGDVYFHYDMGSRGGDTARKLIGGYRGTIQTDGYEVYEAYEGAPGKRMIGCWAHARRYRKDIVIKRRLKLSA